MNFFDYSTIFMVLKTIDKGRKPYTSIWLQSNIPSSKTELRKIKLVFFQFFLKRVWIQKMGTFHNSKQMKKQLNQYEHLLLFLILSLCKIQYISFMIFNDTDILPNISKHLNSHKCYPDTPKLFFSNLLFLTALL